MSGTKKGGQKAKEKNLANNPNFYAIIGAKGGKASNHGGFASKIKGVDGLTGKERAAIAGKVGGNHGKENNDYGLEKSLAQKPF